MNVVGFKNQKTLDDVVKAIHREFAEAAKHDNKAHSCRVAIGHTLNELQARIESGEAGEGVQWWAWYKSRFERSRRDAARCMALARNENPEAAAEQEQKRNRAYKAAQRERDATDSQSGAHGQSEDEDEDEDEGDCDTEQAMWHRGLIYRAGEAIRLAEFDDWSGHAADTSPAEMAGLLDVAKKAAQSWRDVASCLRTLVPNSEKDADTCIAAIISRVETANRKG
jgi:hypothetical protein